MSENAKKNPTPVVFGCSGTSLTSSERALFKRCNPFGIILFKRNCETKSQVLELVAEIRQTVGRQNLQILIDEEGGRVTRLQPPSWSTFPPARTFGLIYERDPEWGTEAIQLYARARSHELASLGITINCAPVVDIFDPDGSPAIGDRAYSASPSTVAALARVHIETSLACGILPVIKHLPGHGRLRKDPHKELPTIDTSRAELEAQDFVPFELLKDAPLGMNSHAVFKALDPEKPASLSRVVNTEIIRGTLGFDGVLFSDDLAMKALDGQADRLARGALNAGCDIVLHCSGEMIPMESIASTLAPMEDASMERWRHAQAMVSPVNPHYDPHDDLERLDILLGGLAFQEAS